MFVGQPPTFCACDQQPRARAVVNVARIVAEGELVAVAIQMSSSHVVIDAVDSTFQEREKAFNCVRMGIPTDVFIGRVFDDSVTGGKSCVGGRGRLR